jgi:hypothetical protein
VISDLLAMLILSRRLKISDLLAMLIFSRRLAQPLPGSSILRSSCSAVAGLSGATRRPAGGGENFSRRCGAISIAHAVRHDCGLRLGTVI